MDDGDSDPASMSVTVAISALGENVGRMGTGKSVCGCSFMFISVKGVAGVMGSAVVGVTT